MRGPELASYREDDANGIGLHHGGERAVAGTDQISFGDRGSVNAADDRRRNLGMAETDLRRLDLRSAAFAGRVGILCADRRIDGLLRDFGSIAAFVLALVLFCG
jgi:hypothetical protein